MKDKCIVTQYSQAVPEYGVTQKGELTAGEDTADNGGIHLAMMRRQGQPMVHEPACRVW